MTYQALQVSLRDLHLDIFGAFHPAPQDATPAGTKTLLLLGPHEPGFWQNFTTTSEYLDHKPDPLDRWSKRILAPWAKAHNAMALFPSDGPPYAPFIDWAHRSGHTWQSPVGLLVHDHAGLFISFRAAISLPTRLVLPANGMNPCITCQTRPCLSACPVSALSPDGYDVPKCKTYLNTTSGLTCMETGCLVRNACPAGYEYARLPEQSAFHMAAFNPK